MAAPKRKGGLGRGLSSLFEDVPVHVEEYVKTTEQAAESKGKKGEVAGEIVFLDINDIKPNANQPRKEFNDEKIDELARSIEIHGVIQPIIVSGQAGSSGGKVKEPFMEEYLVDYVRVYAYPQNDLPQLEWKSRPENDIVKTGTVLKFAADAQPNAETKSPITGVYLFDNGYLVDYKNKAPYNFELPLTQDRQE